MIKIIEIEQILNLKQEITVLKKGFLTNFFLDNEKIQLLIDKNLIDYLKINETLFFFKSNDNFKNLYYFTTNKTSLEIDLKQLKALFPNQVFVSDLIDKKNNIHFLENIFENAGFNQYVSLIRMSRMVNENECYKQENENLKFSKIDDINKVNQLLNDFFDTFAEQLPLLEELNKLVINKNILLYTDKKNNIEGFLIFEINGLTSYLRYWFVHPNHRDKKIGSILLNKFFELSKKTKRQLFWVIETNDNAIKRYEHYGFQKEALLDSIMINNNKKYEK